MSTIKEKSKHIGDQIRLVQEGESQVNLLKDFSSKIHSICIRASQTPGKYMQAKDIKVHAITFATQPFTFMDKENQVEIVVFVGDHQTGLRNSDEKSCLRVEYYEMTHQLNDPPMSSDEYSIEDTRLWVQQKNGKFLPMERLDPRLNSHIDYVQSVLKSVEQILDGIKPI